ncbi:MAG TPA: hypothetical protein VGC98_05060 [Thermoleophilaceae bacterium]|jgi:hypothetical protein
MAPLTADQRRRRERVETLISLAAPALNLLLAFGDRVSRIVEPEDSEYYPVRSGLTEGDAAKGPASGD